MIFRRGPGRQPPGNWKPARLARPGEGSKPGGSRERGSGFGQRERARDGRGKKSKSAGAWTAQKKSGRTVRHVRAASASTERTSVLGELAI